MDMRNFAALRAKSQCAMLAFSRNSKICFAPPQQQRKDAGKQLQHFLVCQLRVYV
jgi:hypothetical protein